MKFYTYIWNERGTSKEQGANKTLDIVLAYTEDRIKFVDAPTEDRLFLRFYRSTEGEIVLSIRGNNRVRVEDKRK